MKENVANNWKDLKTKSSETSLLISKKKKKKKNKKKKKRKKKLYFQSNLRRVPKISPGKLSLTAVQWTKNIKAKISEESLETKAFAS